MILERWIWCIFLLFRLRRFGLFSELRRILLLVMKFGDVSICMVDSVVVVLLDLFFLMKLIWWFLLIDSEMLVMVCMMFLEVGKFMDILCRLRMVMI